MIWTVRFRRHYKILLDVGLLEGGGGGGHHSLFSYVFMEPIVVHEMMSGDWCQELFEAP